MTFLAICGSNIEYTPPLDRNTDGLTDKHDIHRYTPPTFLKRGEQKFFLLVDFL